MKPGDGIDNDCDVSVDEEVLDGKDNDGDGKIDEDLELVGLGFYCNVNLTIERVADS